jgi:hypothetical protein
MADAFGERQPRGMTASARLAAARRRMEHSAGTLADGHLAAGLDEDQRSWRRRYRVCLDAAVGPWTLGAAGLVAASARLAGETPATLSATRVSTL